MTVEEGVMVGDGGGPFEDDTVRLAIKVVNAPESQACFFCRRLWRACIRSGPDDVLQ